MHAIRDHGGVIFLDLRDHYGITQLVVNEQTDEALPQIARTIHPESVIRVEGCVRARVPTAINPHNQTGEIEVHCRTIRVESPAQPLPFPVADEGKIPEELRLKYRFLDLRRACTHQHMLLRARVIAEIRSIMHSLGFVEYQTPILTVSSPEGARDFLVPSRRYPGHFYALPQAPQQYKQLIMCAGFDRYFQIAPCFRDEDARADRTPGEFYQLDIEMSFIDQEDLFQVIEALLTQLTARVSTKRIQAVPFTRLTYHEAWDGYGTDKPDLRFDLPLCDVTALFRDTAFHPFAIHTGDGHCIKAIVLHGGAAHSRAFYDRLDDYAKELGGDGLPYLCWRADAVSGSLAKRLNVDELTLLREFLDVQPGDAVVFTAGAWRETCEFMGKIRRRLAEETLSLPGNLLAFCWIIDFPFYVPGEEEGTIQFFHNPFSMPQGGLDALHQQPPLTILAQQFDLVCNGIELSSGAIRNTQPELMYEAFRLAGYAREVVDEKFGHMLAAFRYGAPPHGGIAPGIDRLLMLYTDEANLREVIMFPMNQKAQELMVGSPATATAQQLAELHLVIKDEG